MDKIITQKQVINLIGNKLQDELVDLGFKFIKSKSHLLRKTKEGFDRILLYTYDAYPVSHQVLHIQLMKRINTVEDIVNQFYDHRFKNTKNDNLTTTISVDFNTLNTNNSNFIFESKQTKNCLLCQQTEKEEYEHFVLHNEQDINNVIPVLLTFINEKGLAFFKLNSNLSNVNVHKKRQLEKVLDSNGWIFPLEFIYSLTLMYLTKDSDYENIKNKYKEKLRIPNNPDDVLNSLEIEATNELMLYLDGQRVKG